MASAAKDVESQDPGDLDPLELGHGFEDRHRQVPNLEISDSKARHGRAAKHPARVSTQPTGAGRAHLLPLGRVRDAHDLADLGSGRKVLAGDRGHGSAQIHDEAPDRASFDLCVHESEVSGEVQDSLTGEPFLDVHGPPRLQRDREVARLERHLPREQIDCRAWIRLAGAAFDVKHAERSVRSYHAYT